MRRAAAAIPFLAFALATGCGYVGPVVPPSAKIPMAITDLSVVEQGDQLVVTFTPPNRTTDEFAIDTFSAFDLRVGTGRLDSAKSYDIPVTTKPVQYTVPVSDWVGQHVSFAVRTAVKKDKNYSAWSNAVQIPVAKPLSVPVLAADPTAQGYKLTWQDNGAGVKYDVLRKTPTDTKFVQLATVDTPQFVDANTQWGVPVTYQVRAHTNSAESPLSEPLTVTHADTFAPATPSGLASATTGDSIELSWARDTEADLKGYYIYRANESGPFTKVRDLAPLPTFSDHTVEHGKTYQYKVSAIDQTGNESAPSSPISATLP